MAAGWLPLTAHPLPWTAAAFAVLPGAALVPALASGADLTHLLLPGAGAEASGWLLAALGIGEAAATATVGAHPATWWPAALAALACALALTPASRARPATALPWTPPILPERS